MGVAVTKKPNFLKKMASYFYSFLLEQAESPISGPLELHYRQGRYMLSTAHAIYSYEDLYHNFRLAFNYLQPEKKGIQSVLILGFAMGSICQLLESRGLKANYLGIEIDPIIIDWSERYILSELSANICIQQADAAKFLQRNTDKFELILIDLFVDNQVPEAFRTIDFLQNIQEHLAPNGRIIYNSMSDQKGHPAFLEQFRQVFPKMHSLEIGKNQLLFNFA